MKWIQCISLLVSCSLLVVTLDRDKQAQQINSIRGLFPNKENR